MTTNRNSERERTACEKTRDDRFPRWLTPARDDDGKSVIGTTEVVPFSISRSVVFFRSLRSRALPQSGANRSFLRSGFDPLRQTRQSFPVASTAEGVCPYVISECKAESSHPYVVCCWTGRGGCPYMVRHCALRACRARRCLGWTSQAIPMLTRYSATMGAAKIHMFRMSVVGVRMAAMMKMTRME